MKAPQNPLSTHSRVCVDGPREQGRVIIPLLTPSPRTPGQGTAPVSRAYSASPAGQGRPEARIEVPRADRRGGARCVRWAVVRFPVLALLGQ
jgi:hypothetical protein